MNNVKNILIEVSQDEKGCQSIKFSNAGFTDLELIGICEVLRVQNIVRFKQKIEQLEEAGDE